MEYNDFIIFMKNLGYSFSDNQHHMYHSSDEYPTVLVSDFVTIRDLKLGKIFTDKHITYTFDEIRDKFLVYIRKEKIEKIKYLRLAKEERFMLGKLESCERFEYQSSVFYVDYNKVLLEIKDNEIICDYYGLWSVLELTYDKYSDISKFITDVVNQYLSLECTNASKVYIPNGRINYWYIVGQKHKDKWNKERYYKEPKILTFLKKLIRV